MRRPTLTTLGASIALVACSSSGTGTATQSATAARPAAAQSAPARSSRTVLLRTELSEVQQAEMDAYQAIRQFRPNMLLGTPAASMGAGGQGFGLTVFLNGNKQGGIDALQSIRMIEVEKIEYLNGSDATQKFGTGYGGGVIMVTRRK